MIVVGREGSVRGDDRESEGSTASQTDRTSAEQVDASRHPEPREIADDLLKHLRGG